MSLSLLKLRKVSSLLSRNISVSSTLCKDDKPHLDELKSVKESLYDRQLPNPDELEEFEKLPKFENPIKRTGRILKTDLVNGMHKVQRFMGFEKPPQEKIFPTHTDILVIGGGAMGSSTAYWLKQRAPHGFHLTVVEKDSSYCEASTTLSVGGVRQQFCLPESIEMSLFGAEFIRNMKRHLDVDGHGCPDPQFQPYGYLFLATEKGAETLQENSKLQCELGAKNVILTPSQLKNKFPWLNTDGVALGCLGLENEGWFDPWSLLNGFKQKAINLGAEYIQGEVVGFEFDNFGDMIRDSGEKYEKLEKAIVKMPDGEFKTIKFAHVIIAAGAYSGIVAKMAKVGVAGGMRATPLPIEPRKRFVYVVHCPDGPGLNTPLMIDPTGVYFRREGLGGNYITGCSPSPDEEPPVENLDVDYDFFDNKIWPILANRVPAFERLKLKNAWAGYYEYNVLDANGIVGRHPYYHNLFIAAGFSGHGIQHSPAVGRAIMELILDGQYKSIDLTRLGFERLQFNEPLLERNIW